MPGIISGLQTIGNFFSRDKKTARAEEIALQAGSKGEIDTLRELFKQEKASEIVRGYKGFTRHLEQLLKTDLATKNEGKFKDYKESCRNKTSALGYCSFTDESNSEHDCKAFQIVKDGNVQRRLNIFPPGKESRFLDVRDQTKCLLEGLKRANSPKSEEYMATMERFNVKNSEDIDKALKQKMDPEEYRSFMEGVEKLILKLTAVQVKGETYYNCTLGEVPPENEGKDDLFLDIKSSDQQKLTEEEEGRKRAHSESEIKDKAKRAAKEASKGRERSRTI